MSIETKLREGSQAIKQATRTAEFTSESPADRRTHVRGPVLAWVSGLAVIGLLAVPALLMRVGDQPSEGAGVGAAPTPIEFPHLTLELADTELVAAYENFDENGERIGTHSVYHQEIAETGSDAAPGGREILVRVQRTGAVFDRFDYYAPLASGTDTVEVGGRSVTVHLIPDDAIDEGNYDLGILQWTEAPGYEVIVIPWGLDKDGALSLMDGLTAINESEWEELRGPKPEVIVTTTIVKSETPTTGAVDAPGDPASARP